MTTAIVPKELLTATLGGLSLLVVSGGADGQVLTQQPDGTYAPEAVSAGIGGSVGSTDNRLVRSDGTGGSTVQSTGITVDDSNNVSGIGTLDASLQIRSLTSVRCMQINDNINARQMIFGGGFIQVDQPVYFVSTLFLNGGGTTSISFSSAGVAQIGTTASNALGSLLLTNLTASGLLCAGVYTFATVPSASSNTGKFLRISDRAQKHAYSDGTNWRFFGDDAIIS